MFNGPPIGLRRFCLVLSVLSSFDFILAGCFTLIVSKCIVTVSVLWLFLMVQWVGVQCVIMIFPDHIYSFTYTTCFLNDKREHYL